MDGSAWRNARPTVKKWIWMRDLSTRNTNLPVMGPLWNGVYVGVGRAGKSSHNSCNCVIVVNSTIFWGKRRWNRWFLDYSVILSNHDGKLEKWEFLHHLIKWRWKLCECIIKYVFGRRLHFSRLTSKNLLIKNLERKLCIFWQEDYLYRKSVYIINSRKLQIACKMYTYIINRIQ